MLNVGCKGQDAILSKGMRIFCWSLGIVCFSAIVLNVYWIDAGSGKMRGPILEMRSRLEAARQMAITRKTEVTVSFLQDHAGVRVITAGAGFANSSRILPDYFLGCITSPAVPDAIVFDQSGAATTKDHYDIVVSHKNDADKGFRLRVFGKTGRANVIETE